MRTTLLYLCIFLSLSCFSCRNKNPNLSKDGLLTELNKEPEKKTEVAVIPEGYVPPAGIRYEAKRDLSEPAVHLDVLAGMKNEWPVKLSDFGKEVVYHRIGVFEFGLRLPIYPVDNGFLAKADSGLWLLTADFKKDRMLVKEDIEIMKKNDYVMWRPHVAVQSFFYDPASRLLYILQIRDLKEEGSPLERSVSNIFIDDLLQKDRPVDLATLNNRTKIGMASGIMPAKDGYALYGNWIYGLYTFDMKGDTLCHFVSGKELFEKIEGTVRGAESIDFYLYKGNAYFRSAYTDTIFILKDASTFRPAYKIDLGPYQATRSEGMKVSFDLSEKYLVHSITETDNWLFLGVTQNYDCPNNRNSGAVRFYQLIYDKRSGRLSSFIDRKHISQPGLVPNDLDGGPGFWPNVQIEGKPYMLLNGKELKKEVPGERLDKIEDLQGLDDDEMILITIK